MRKLFSFLIIVLILSLAGCQERKSKEPVQLEKQPPSASSGQADWKLAVSARFLRSDGSWYLTAQQHDITIEPKALTISAQEPFGKIILTVKNENFNLQKNPGNDFDQQLIELMTDEGICKGLLELYLAEIENIPQIKSSQTNPFFSFEGRAYELISNQNGIEIYKNQSTKNNDLVITTGNKRYILFGYNYIKVKENSYFPSKIDIYTYNESDRKLIAQYEGRLL